MLETFVDAFMYEPAIEFGKGQEVTQYKYICDKPLSLPKYLKHFVPPDTSILLKDGPDIVQCIGIDGVNKPHIFLKAEG